MRIPAPWRFGATGLAVFATLVACSRGNATGTSNGTRSPANSGASLASPAATAPSSTSSTPATRLSAQAFCADTAKDTSGFFLGKVLDVSATNKFAGEASELDRLAGEAPEAVFADLTVLASFFRTYQSSLGTSTPSDQQRDAAFLSATSQIGGERLSAAAASVQQFGTANCGKTLGFVFSNSGFDDFSSLSADVADDSSSASVAGR